MLTDNIVIPFVTRFIMFLFRYAMVIHETLYVQQTYSNASYDTKTHVFPRVLTPSSKHLNTYLSDE